MTNSEILIGLLGNVFYNLGSVYLGWDGMGIWTLEIFYFNRSLGVGIESGGREGWRK